MRFLSFTTLLCGLLACQGASLQKPRASSSSVASVQPRPAPATGPDWQPTLSCSAPLFIDKISNWSERRVAGGGMDAIRRAIDGAPKDKAVRITIAAGTYTGQCLYIENHQRNEQHPLWIRGEGTVQLDCHDGNGQAIGLENASWIALDNLTVGPASGYYGDSAVHIAGHPVEIENPARYGQYQLSHHVIVRRLTARNLNRGPDGDADPDAYESGCCDGIKVNQAEQVWLIDNQISRTARHGIDLVGVHQAAICANRLTDMVGAGHGLEAKGGSQDILFEGNTVFRARHRGLLLGGEGTADVYMYPIGAKFEGTHQLARNNLLIDASEGGLGFYGCQDCAAVANTVWQTQGFGSETRDFIRMFESILEAGEEWGGARRVGEMIPSRDNLVINNFFGAAEPGVTCAFEASPHGVAGLSMHHNLWWNGGQPLPECGEGQQSITAYPDPASSFADADPALLDPGTPSQLPNLTPRPDSPLIGKGAAHRLNPSVDASGRPRPALLSIGALEP
ncbi:MAG TPA: right-handed parallel beta-helix repeat-containing protein [Candidatus Obscuribacterales bacterium]